MMIYKIDWLSSLKLKLEKFKISLIKQILSFYSTFLYSLE